jgi:hypothetical protein
MFRQIVFVVGLLEEWQVGQVILEVSDLGLVPECAREMLGRAGPAFRG